MKRFVIFLVYGTFARFLGADWTQPESELRRVIASQAPAPVEFRVFKWSSLNSFSARTRAADRLRHEVRDVLVNGDDIECVLIGHSHGGTISALAADCDDLRSRVRVCCLATPFFSAYQRNLSQKSYLGMGILIWLISAAISLYFAFKWGPLHRLALRSWEQHAELPAGVVPPPNVPDFVVLLLGVAIGGGTALAVYIAAMGLKRYAHSVASSLEVHGTVKLLLIRVEGDEATMWIGLHQFFNWVIGVISSVYDRAAERAREWCSDETKAAWMFPVGRIPFFVLGFGNGAFVAAIGSLWMCVVLVAPIMFLLLEHPNPLIRVMLIVWLTLISSGIARWLLKFAADTLFLFSLPLSVIMVPIWVASIISGPVSFGFGAGALSLFFELSVEPCPLGEWTVHLFRTRPQGLHHSQSWEHPEALALMAGWIACCGASSYAAAATDA